MSRTCGLLGIAVVAVLLCVPAWADSIASPRAERIDARIESFLAAATYGGVGPALSIAISVGGSPVLEKGYGEAQPGVGASAETHFLAGSITKQFTAAAVLDLIDRGAIVERTGRPLGLETELTEVFDGVAHWSADAAHPITVRRLLNMSSNLPNFTRRPPESADPWGAIPAQQLLAEIKRLGPTGWPATFEYSNTSYFLLAEIMEAVTVPGDGGAQDYRSIVKRRLIDPLALSATGFAGDGSNEGVLAQPIHRRRPAFLQPDWLKGSGDLVSSAHDIARWNAALMNGEILTTDARAAMFGDGGRIGPTDWYGMGWFISHETDFDVFSHSGTVPGYTSFNAIFKSRNGRPWVSVTLLSNIDNAAEIDGLARAIADIVLYD